MLCCQIEIYILHFNAQLIQVFIFNTGVASPISRTTITRYQKLTKLNYKGFLNKSKYFQIVPDINNTCATWPDHRRKANIPTTCAGVILLINFTSTAHATVAVLSHELVQQTISHVCHVTPSHIAFTNVVASETPCSSKLDIYTFNRQTSLIITTSCMTGVLLEIYISKNW